jgi:hypothetical protein
LKPKFHEVLKILQQMVLPPSEYGRTVALEVARTYIRNPGFCGTVHLNDVKDLLGAWCWLYPDEPDIQIALAILENRVEDIFNACCRLHRACQIQYLDPAKQSAMRRALEIWKSEIANDYARYPNTPRFLEIPWELPAIFSGQDVEPLDMANFVALTEMRTKEITDDTGALVKMADAGGVIARVDRVGDFVDESWGDLGVTILDAIGDILSSVVNSPSTFRKNLDHIEAWPFSECTFVASHSSLGITAICPISMWRSLTACVLWIIDVVGQPQKEGLYKRGPFYRVGDVYGADLPPQISASEPRERKVIEATSVSEAAQRELERMKSLVPRSTDHQLPLTACEVVVREYREEEDMAEAQPPYDLCWKGLFERAFIAPYRLPFVIFGSLEKCGKGLRVPFDLMISIAGVERAIFREGGFVFTGLSTALIPIHVICEKPRLIQWHLIEMKCNDGRFRSMHDRDDFWDNLPRERLFERNMDKLKGIAYLGWLEQVDINHTPAQVRYSSLSQISQKWVVNQEGIQFGGQIGLPGGAAIQAQVARNWGKVCLGLRFPASGMFSRRIEALYEGTVFIYDDESETAWLCATIDLIILMLRYYLSRNQYRDPLSFRERVANLQQHEESMKAFMNLRLDTKVIPEYPGSDTLTYGSLINDFSEQFGKAFGSLSDVLRQRSSDKIIGFDFIELINGTIGGAIFPKELPVKGGIRGWSSLVGTADVIFCKGVGNLIKPSGSGTRAVQICPFIQRPLRGSNLLICPVYLLKRRLEQQSCAFHPHYVVKQKTYKWVFTGHPFRCLETGCNETNCWKNRIQYVSAVDTFVVKMISRWEKFGKGSEGSSCSISLDGDGAICFGRL